MVVETQLTTRLRFISSVEGSEELLGLNKDVQRLTGQFGKFKVEARGITEGKGILGKEFALVDKRFKILGIGFKGLIGSGEDLAYQYKLVTQRINKVAGSFTETTKTVNRFRSELLSVLFGAIALQRIFKSIVTAGVGTFRRIKEAGNDFSSAVSQLALNFEFLKFSIGSAINRALEPLLPLLINIIRNIAEFVQKNPQTTFDILVGGFIALSGAVALISFSLALDGLKKFVDIASGANTPLTDLTHSIGGLQGLLKQGIGLFFIYEGFKDFKAGDIIKSLGEVLGGVGLFLLGTQGDFRRNHILVGVGAALILLDAATKGGIDFGTFLQASALGFAGFGLKGGLITISAAILIDTILGEGKLLATLTKFAVSTVLSLASALNQLLATIIFNLFNAFIKLIDFLPGVNIKPLPQTEIDTLSKSFSFSKETIDNLTEGALNLLVKFDLVSQSAENSALGINTNTDAINSQTKTLQSATEGLTTLSSSVQSASNSMNAASQAFVDSGNLMIEYVTSASGKFGVKARGLGKIPAPQAVPTGRFLPTGEPIFGAPKKQFGGLITKGGLIRVEAGESVVPANSTSFGNVNIVINSGAANVKEIAEQIDREMMRVFRKYNLSLAR